MTNPGPWSPAPILVLYHRPPEEPFHGGAATLRAFVAGLKESGPVEVVSPPSPPGPPGEPGESPGSSLATRTTLRHLSGVLRPIVRSFLSERRVHARPGSRVVVAFGGVIAGPALLWARLRGHLLVSFPQDVTPEVGRRWGQLGVPGGAAIRWVVWPIERLAARRSALVLVFSADMRDAFVREGIDAARLQIFFVPRELPVFDPARAQQWRDRLGLAGRVGVVFLGTFAYAPNARAFEFIRRELAPRLATGAPEALVLVVGWGSEAYRDAVPSNVRVLGGVEDLDGLLSACSIGIAPMETPGGRSNKIADYALHGLTTIATPEAAAGMPPSPNLLVVPRADFGRRLVEQIRSEPPWAGGEKHRPPDPVYVELNRRFAGPELGFQLRRLLPDGEGS